MSRVISCRMVFFSLAAFWHSCIAPVLWVLWVLVQHWCSCAGCAACAASAAAQLRDGSDDFVIAGRGTSQHRQPRPCKPRALCPLLCTRAAGRAARGVHVAEIALFANLHADGGEYTTAPHRSQHSTTHDIETIWNCRLHAAMPCIMLPKPRRGTA